MSFVDTVVGDEPMNFFTGSNPFLVIFEKVQVFERAHHLLGISLMKPISALYSIR